MGSQIPPTTGVVLAGGQGTRMQGRDKGLLTFRRRPLVAYALDALRGQVGRVLINANRNLREYAAFRVPVVTDTVPGFQGPLAGMLAGLRFAETEWALFVPCDAVFVPSDLARRLYAGVRTGKRAAYATADGDGLYTCCLLNRDLADDIERALNDERRAVHRLLEECDAAVVEFRDWPAVARNLNTPADIRKAVKALDTLQ